VWLRQATRIIVVALFFYLLARSLVALVRRFRDSALPWCWSNGFPSSSGIG